MDGPDPDNYAAALAATSSEYSIAIGGVIMTGRPVNPDHTAKPYEADPAASRAIRHDNAVRMKDLLVRHGRSDVPVYEGGLAPYSTIPHRVHIDEHVLDIAPPLPDSQLAGYLADAADRIADLPDTTKVDLICAGPLTDAVHLMSDERIRPKLGALTAQLGMFGDPQVATMAGGRRQFNVLADADAVRETLAGYPGPVYMIPTDVTKRAEFSFANPDELAALSTTPAFDHLAEMYRRAWPHMWEPRGEKIYVHDFHPVELMADLDTSRQPPVDVQAGQPQDLGRYTLSRVSIAHVPSPGPGDDRAEESRWGEIDLAATPDPQGPPRFLATDVDSDPARHRDTLSRVLNAAPSQPGLQDTSARQLAAAQVVGGSRTGTWSPARRQQGARGR
ncbi:nucleoside hydrolase [Kribbella kalugense]|uniref:nucleoside hydrolase n=1 Tax=Kribbella kalugense TaxID=2512221 RepID=UPI001416FAAB|nr:nucleoside hydrolase [Kribbella kalugense]